MSEKDLWDFRRACFYRDIDRVVRVLDDHPGPWTREAIVALLYEMPCPMPPTEEGAAQ